MKQTILFGLLILLSAPATSQVFQSNCTANAQVEAIYRNDAYRLAVTRVQQLNLHWKDSIDIPVIYIDSISKALYSIHNMDWSPLKDTILTMFGSATFSTFSNIPPDDSTHFRGISPKTIEIQLASTASWYSSWQNGNFSSTPDNQVNALVTQYGLQPTGMTDLWPAYRFYSIRTPRAVNTFGLVKAFLNTTGVMSANVQGYIGDGNILSLQYEPGGIKLIYRHGCGDCPSGCTYGRIWEFKYYFSNCAVEYLTGYNWGGTYGHIFGNEPWTCLGSIMPVTFSSIKAQLKDNFPVIDWQVYSETDMKEYIIERSMNGTGFSVAGAVAAKGNSTVAVAYNWIDNEAPTGKVFYRVKAVSRNQEIKYSNTVTVDIKPANSFIIYPNPVQGKSITVRSNLVEGGNYILQLMDAAGKMIISHHLQLNKGINYNEIHLPARISPGTYTMILFNGQFNNKQLLVLL